tara:strand:+ start:246 stop:446 length:201 start_codon:yes stop_codon:yes gene_type:complete
VVIKGYSNSCVWLNCISERVKTEAPSIAGIANIKENFAASLLEIPNKSAKDIVIPEREIPGIIASA